MQAVGRAGGWTDKQAGGLFCSIPPRFILCVRPCMHACAINVPAGMQAGGQAGVSVYWCKCASGYAYMRTCLYLDLRFCRFDSRPLEQYTGLASAHLDRRVRRQMYRHV